MNRKLLRGLLLGALALLLLPAGARLVQAAQQPSEEPDTPQFPMPGQEEFPISIGEEDAWEEAAPDFVAEPNTNPYLFPEQSFFPNASLTKGPYAPPKWLLDPSVWELVNNWDFERFRQMDLERLGKVYLEPAQHDDAKRLDLEIQTKQPTYTMVDVRRNRPLSLTVTNRTGQALLLDDLRWEYFELEWEHDGVWYVLPPEGERAITLQYVIGDLPPGESTEIASMWGWDSYEREFEPGHYRVVWSRDDGAWSAGEFTLNEASLTPVERDAEKMADELWMRLELPKEKFSTDEMKGSAPLTLTVTNYTEREISLAELHDQSRYTLEVQKDGAWYSIPGPSGAGSGAVEGVLQPEESTQVQLSDWNWDAYESDFPPGYYHIVWTGSDGTWSSAGVTVEGAPMILTKRMMSPGPYDNGMSDYSSTGWEQNGVWYDLKSKFGYWVVHSLDGQIVKYGAIPPGTTNMDFLEAEEELKHLPPGEYEVSFSFNTENGDSFGGGVLTIPPEDSAEPSAP